MEKTSTRLQYATRLDRVIDYIYDHLDEDVGFDRLAEVACLSPYHWHRIYAAMRGETITATTRRLRLARAAERLANSDMAIPVIAERAGHRSLDAFARAFGEAYGITPVAYRTKGSHTTFKAANVISDTGGFPVTMETVPPRYCAAIRHSGPYVQIDRAMGRLFAELTTQGLMPSAPQMMAVFFDDPDLVPSKELRSQACVPLDASTVPAAPLDASTLRGGVYARLRYQGPYADMKDAYRWLLGVWLPASPYDADDFPVIEAYRNDPRDVPATELLTDIYLPLRAS